MSRILAVLNEAQSQWELKHSLINALVKKGVGETSYLWLATQDELEQMAQEAGIPLPVAEAPMINGVQPVNPSMPNPGTQPQGTQSVNQVPKVQPAAQVAINQQTANTQPGSTTVNPQNMQTAINSMSSQDKTKFLQILQQLAGIKQ